METQPVSLLSGKRQQCLAGVRLILIVVLIVAVAHPLIASPMDNATQVTQAHLFMEPLVWVGKQSPPDLESEELLGDVGIFKSDGAKAGYSALENFLSAHPRSAWAPALEVNIAGYYRRMGRYSLALSQWQAAWDATKDSKDAAGQKVAVQAFAGLTRLLASLGHKDELESLYAELDARQFRLGESSTMIGETKEGMEMMSARPGSSYRCGSYALGNMAMALHLNQSIIRQLFAADSPNGGFTIGELLALATTNGFAVEAVQQPAGADLVIPSVVHWKLNHYAAIVEKKGDRYLVKDPTFEGQIWMDAATIEAESSGDYILPKDKVPASWEKLNQVACSKIYGKGNPAIFNDANDNGPHDKCHPPPQPCDPPTPNDGAGGGGGAPQPPGCNGCGSGGPGPGPKGGMPEWYVSEPYITLWLTDAPLLYRQSNQQWFPLDLYYKSRGDAQNTGLPGFGDNWSCGWFDMLQQSDTGNISNVLSSGAVRYINTNGPDYHSGGIFLPAVTVSETDPQAIVMPDGSEVVYGYTNSDLSGDLTNYLVIARLDQYGRTLERFHYTNSSGVVQLTSVVDLDGRTNKLTYGDASHPWLITAVTDPYTQTTHFYYSFSQDSTGLLTNLVDSQGMSTFFQYDSSNQITSMITPYGTDSFQYFAAVDPISHTPDRAILITEPDGSQQLYAHPTRSPDTSGGDPTAVSYHWNRSQYQSVADKTNVFTMQATDYQLASQKEWLYEPDVTTLSDTLKAQYGAGLDPEEYNLRPGEVFYLYPGEFPFASPSTVGTSALVSNIANYESISITRNDLERPIAYTYNDDNGDQVVYTNIFDPSGRILQYELGPNNELTRGYGYDPVITNLLTSVTNAAGDVLRYTHATNTLKVTSIIFPTGLVRTNIYYTNGLEQGFLEIQADLGIRTNSFAWQNGNLTAQTNELGLVTTYTYDNLNRLTSVGYLDGTTTSNIYNNLDVVATKDRLNQWTYFSYNAVRQVIATTNADGQVTTYDYCGCGSPDQINEWNGSTQLTILLNYDINGQLTNVMYPDGYELSYAYDFYDRLTSISDAHGDQLDLNWYAYGLQFLSQSATLNGAQLLSQQYDKYGRVKSSTDRNNVTTTNGYDFLSRLVARQSFSNSGDGTKTGLETFNYGPQGLTNYIDQLAHVTSFVRDLAGRVTAETNANKEVLQFTYNPADELLTLTDGKSQTTHWNYDQYGRVTNKVDAAGTNDFVYQYDPNNRLTNRWSAAKGMTVYRYDQLGNLTNVDYSGGTVFTPSIYFVYDGLNRLTNMLDGFGNTTFTWTPGNQLAVENGPWGEDAVNYNYDPNSRLRIGMSVAAPNATPWAQSYAYDSVMRLSSVVSPAGEFDYLGYSGAMDQPEEISMSGGYSYIYNGFDGLARLGSTSLNTPLWNDQRGYYYDAGSEVTQQVFTANSSIYHWLNYNYDNIGQLKGAQGYDGQPGNPPNPARLQEQFGYAYDKAWNLNMRTNNALIESFGVNSVNELSSISRSGTLTVAGTATEPSGNSPVNASPGVTSVTVNTTNAMVYGDGTFTATNMPVANGNNTYTAIAQDNIGRWSTNSITVNLPSSSSFYYDANGNLTNDGTRNFCYDDENQLTGVWVANTWSNCFVYDGLLRKRVEKDYIWTGGAWSETNEVRFIYDGYAVVQERDANNLPRVTYTRGNDLSGSLQGSDGIGGLLARTDMGLWVANQPFASAYYFSDAQGNIVAMVNTNGSLVAHYEYDPFGNVLVKSGPLADANRYRFSSKEWNDTAGLYYYGFRFYDPNLQRWPNRDPLGDLGGLSYLEPLLPEADNSTGASGVSEDALLNAWTQVNLNLYGIARNNSVDSYDILGFCTYRQNRQLFPNLLNHAPWPRSQYDPLSHTFIFTTNPDGSVAHTYSWGNTANPEGWNEDQPEDIAAANEALKLGGNYLNKVGDSSLDPYVNQAFNNLKQNEPEHPNGIIDNNCKSEATGLTDEAQQLQQQNQGNGNGNGQGQPSPNSCPN